mmetsp:Transcript_105660/g.268423  ORF Transcript_105660/g.268423 Transcript_105660/m.268423 type:complete len:260 (+) Transcript_105660:295-1074(+)
MNWGFACCCSPAHAGDSEKIADRPSAQGDRSSAPRLGGSGGVDQVAAKPDEEKRHASAAGFVPPALALAAAAGGGGRGLAPAPASAEPSRGGGGGSGGGGAEQEKEQDLETMSVASSRVSGRSVRSTFTASSIASEFINERMGQSKIQQAMKTFVRAMVRGQQMGVISPDGALRTCQCSLDKKLKTFIIELKGSVRQIPLTEMSDVFQGKEPEDIDTPLDELCSTVMLQSQECISFHFADVPSREQFAMCLQMLVDGQQ